MLAYVFWHWRRSEIAVPAYVRAQAAFHAALRAEPPAGFLASSSAVLTGAPWANDSGEVFEDWYLLRDSAALDPLNEAAVTASRRGPHDAAAAAAAGGVAGLYALRLGSVPEQVTVAQWFAKPMEARYGEVWEELEPLVRAGGGALWMRRMVLGPSPEFCLRTASAVSLPSRYQALQVTLRRLL